MGWFKIKARTNLGPQNYMYLSRRGLGVKEKGLRASFSKQNRLMSILEFPLGNGKTNTVIERTDIHSRNSDPSMDDIVKLEISASAALKQHENKMSKSSTALLSVTESSCFDTLTDLRVNLSKKLFWTFYLELGFVFPTFALCTHADCASIRSRNLGLELRSISVFISLIVCVSREIEHERNSNGIHNF